MPACAGMNGGRIQHEKTAGPKPIHSMRPLLHPSLVNGRFGDPAVYVEHLFARQALLIDLGDITGLPARKINRIDTVFVSHDMSTISSASTICCGCWSAATRRCRCSARRA